MNIVEFLEARIAEDEAAVEAAIEWVANGPAPQFLWYGGAHRTTFGGGYDLVTSQSPARVLAECKAKLWTLETLRSYEPNDEWHTEPDMGKRLNNAAGAVRVMAAVYADHPDYQSEWAV